MTLSEKAAYLKGLMDGIKLDTEKDENRLLGKIVEFLQDLAVSVDDLEDNAIAVSDELDEIEDNLDAIDEFLMDDDDDEYDDDFDDEDYDFGDDDYEFDEDPIYEVTCPKWIPRSSNTRSTITRRKKTNKPIPASRHKMIAFCAGSFFKGGSRCLIITTILR